MNYIALAEKVVDRHYFWFNDRDALVSIAAEAIWEAEGKYRGGCGSKESFAYTCARNRLCDYIRHVLGRNGGKVVPLPFSNEVLDTLAPPAYDVVLDLDVRHAVAALPDREKDAIYKRYWEGRAVKEIGEEYGVVSSRVTQILKTARKHMVESGYIDVA